MKKHIFTIIGIFIVFFSVQGQNYKNLEVFVSDSFNYKASITVEMSKDPLIAANSLKNALVINGFKVISERVAKESVEFKNKVQLSDSTLNQDISESKTKYLKSVYVITMSYQGREDSGCSGYVMSYLSGQIVDLINDGQIVATFSFKQSIWEGKCTSDVMMALAKKLKELSKK